MSDPFQLFSLVDSELVAGLSLLVARGNELTAEVLAHLAELEVRRIHLELGFPSAFAYCVEALGLSEGAAGRRVAAARVCRRFPSAFALVASGELHLSAICALAPHLSAENGSELLGACRRKTRRQVEEWLAARFPRPDVKAQIRRLPVQANALSLPNATHCGQSEEPGRAGLAPGEGSGPAQCTPCGETAGIAPAPRVGASVSGVGASVSGVGARGVAGPVSPPRRRDIEALAPNRFGVHFTADVELRDLIERARSLASHRLRSVDLSSLMKLAFTTFVEQEEKRRFAVGRKPRESRSRRDRGPSSTLPGAASSSPSQGGDWSSPLAVGASSFTPPGGVASVGSSEASEASDQQGPTDGAMTRNIPIATAAADPVVGPNMGIAIAAVGAATTGQRRGRHISAAVRRAVFARDEGRCSFVAQAGRRCGARAFLELDHVVPWAAQGEADAENIRLLCHAHNDLHARDCFGAEHIADKIARRGSGRQPAKE